MDTLLKPGDEVLLHARVMSIIKQDELKRPLVLMVAILDQGNETERHAVVSASAVKKVVPCP